MNMVSCWFLYSETSFFNQSFQLCFNHGQLSNKSTYGETTSFTWIKRFRTKGGIRPPKSAEPQVISVEPRPKKPGVPYFP